MLKLARVTPATVQVLRELLATDDATWGLRIVGATGRPAGSVYPILARLEEGGWVESCWDDSTRRGPRRRLYELTGPGRAAAAHLVQQTDASAVSARRAAPAGRPALGAS